MKFDDYILELLSGWNLSFILVSLVLTFFWVRSRRPVVSFLFVCNKSLPNKLVKFPMNGKGVGPGGISTGRRDLTQKNVKTNDTRIKERFQPLNSSKI
jgi:hypothetical protein